MESKQEKKTKEDRKMLDSIIFMDSAARQALFDEQRAIGLRDGRQEGLRDGRREGRQEVLSALREFCPDGFADEFIAYYNARKKDEPKE